MHVLGKCGHCEVSNRDAFKKASFGIGLALNNSMQRVVLRDASGHEVTSVMYGESTGHHDSEGIADDGIVTDIERREGVERLMPSRLF